MAKRSTSSGLSKRGRPKGKELSAREHAARIANPTKTGEHAQGAARWLRPCKRRCCPPGLEFPCEARTGRIESGLGAPAYCLIHFPQPHEQELQLLDDAYRQAREGSFEALDAINDQRLAALTLLQMREAQLVMAEGSAVPLFVRNDRGEIELDEEGFPQLLKMLPNPRALVVTELAKITGATASDQLLTPKSQGREPKLDDDAVLAEIREGQELLDALQEEAAQQRQRSKKRRSERKKGRRT